MKDIIESGSRGFRERKLKCNVCNCVFKATPPDFQAIYTENGRIRFVAECPVCHINAYSKAELIKETESGI